MAKYRAAVIGLGWMGMLYDFAERPGPAVDQAPYDLESADRPTPTLDVHRKFYFHDHPGSEGGPISHAEALWDRPEVDLVAGADRDQKRLEGFSERYGVDALYTDATEMLRKEDLDIVAVATNIKGRADLTVLAVECGVRGIITEKPMVNSLEEADRMVEACADAGVPLVGGPVSTSHPSFGRAKEMVAKGEIGEVLSIEAFLQSQHQYWTYFVDGSPAWVLGTGDQERRETGSDEFVGQGFMVSTGGPTVFFRRGAPRLRVTGSKGEMVIDRLGDPWTWWQDVETGGALRRVQMPWPGPQFVTQQGTVYALNDVIDCLEGRLDEPKNSGRRVAMALEVEIALKQSSAHSGARVDLPLEDRSLRLNYDWFR